MQANPSHRVLSQKLEISTHPPTLDTQEHSAHRGTSHFQLPCALAADYLQDTAHGPHMDCQARQGRGDMRISGKSQIGSRTLPSECLITLLQACSPLLHWRNRQLLRFSELPCAPQPLQVLHQRNKWCSGVSCIPPPGSSIVFLQLKLFMRKDACKYLYA